VKTVSRRTGEANAGVAEWQSLYNDPVPNKGLFPEGNCIYCRGGQTDELIFGGHMFISFRVFSSLWMRFTQ
jgi:hypothetical protein